MDQRVVVHTIGRETCSNHLVQPFTCRVDITPTCTGMDHNGVADSGGSDAIGLHVLHPGLNARHVICLCVCIHQGVVAVLIGLEAASAHLIEPMFSTTAVIVFGICPDKKVVAGGIRFKAFGLEGFKHSSSLVCIATSCRLADGVVDPCHRAAVRWKRLFKPTVSHNRRRTGARHTTTRRGFQSTFPQARLRIRCLSRWRHHCWSYLWCRTGALPLALAGTCGGPLALAECTLCGMVA